MMQLIRRVLGIRQPAPPAREPMVEPPGPPSEQVKFDLAVEEIYRAMCGFPHMHTPTVDEIEAAIPDWIERRWIFLARRRLTKQGRIRNNRVEEITPGRWR